jgi:hypothetical protein
LPSLILIVAVTRAGAAAQWMTGVLAVLTVAIAVSNFAVLRAMLATIEAMPR